MVTEPQLALPSKPDSERGNGHTETVLATPLTAENWRKAVVLAVDMANALLAFNEYNGGAPFITIRPEGDKLVLVGENVVEDEMFDLAEVRYVPNLREHYGAHPLAGYWLTRLVGTATIRGLVSDIHDALWDVTGRGPSVIDEGEDSLALPPFVPESPTMH